MLSRLAFAAIFGILCFSLLFCKCDKYGMFYISSTAFSMIFSSSSMISSPVKFPGFPF